MKKIIGGIMGLAILAFGVPAGYGQYFQSRPEHAVRQVEMSNDRDSVIVERMTPFDVPAVNDTVTMIYHEPMPDTIMPKCAVVVGSVTVQCEYAENISPALEKYARKMGADWIISIQEPQALLTADHWKVYRSTATLLRVLDPEFIDQAGIQFSYYEERPFENFAQLLGYYKDFGKRLATQGQ